MSELRVLIISNNALSTVANNGKTILSFIKDLPPDNVAQFYTGTNEFPATEAALKFYRVTEMDSLKSILKFSFKSKNSHYHHLEEIRGLVPGEFQDSKTVSRIKSQAKNLAIVRELIWKFNTWDTKELKDWIEEFKPNAIFAVLGNCIFLHNIAIKLSKRYNLPLSVFFTDDYVINDNSTNFIQRYYYKLLCRKYRKTLIYADKAFVIGESMRKAYEEYFSRNFEVLINGIDFDKLNPGQKPEIGSNNEVIISFIGGIHLNRWKSICKIGGILQKIKKYNIKLRVFCIQHPDEDVMRKFRENGVEYGGRLTPNEVIQQTNKSHILLHVESMDMVNRLYTRFSVSTKIPEYLSSKRGIIAFGPHEVASIKIFTDNNLGCGLTDLDSDLIIENKITKYLNGYNSNDLKKEYDFAYENFDENKMRLSSRINHL